jgi:hypothetical protein
MFDVSGLHVLEVARDEGGRLVLTVESDQTVAGCPGCGVIAGGHGRRGHRVADAPCFAVSTIVVWRKRVWLCREPACSVGTFSERHPLIAPRAKLTARAVGWADRCAGERRHHHLGAGPSSGGGLAHAVGRGRGRGHRPPAAPGPADGVSTLGVDEHAWRPSRHGPDRAVTAMVDPTRDQHGCLRAQLLDVAPGRSGTAYAAWLRDRPPEFTASVEQGL